MTDDELVAFVGNLPKDCIESKTDEEIVFHLPRKNQNCPHCGSSHTNPNEYTTIRLITETDTAYVYRKRRMLCEDCRRTFVEDNPILARYQNTSKNRLRQIRARKKLSQGVVCQQAGIPWHLYKAYERAENPTLPDLATAERIARVLGVAVDEIWDLQEVKRAAREREFERKRLLELKKQREADDAACLSIIRHIETRVKNMSYKEKRQFIDHYNKGHSITDEFRMAKQNSFDGSKGCET